MKANEGKRETDRELDTRREAKNMKQESDHKGSSKMFVKEFGLYPKATENYWVLSRKK